MGHTDRDQRRYATGAEVPADADFDARIDYVGPEPTFLSGRVPAIQTVGMTVTSVRSGDLQPGQSIELDVDIVAGAPHVAIGSNGLPALDSSQYQAGTAIALRAESSGERWAAAEIQPAGDGGGTTYAGRSRR